MLAWILFLIALAAFAGAAFVAYRFYRKAVVYDTIFQYIADDVETNLRQFGKIATSAVLSNEPEVQAAHNNMIIMAKRLHEITMRMEEASGLRLRPPPSPPRPRVV